MNTDADLIVLGGGCAGLSLGERLAESSRRSHRTVVIEAREAYAPDRTWCFWNTAPHRHEALVSKSWNRLQLKSASRSVLVDCRATPYQMLESGCFYERATGLIERSTSVDLLLGTRITGEPERRGDRWIVDTDRGSLSARQIVDTRPAAAPREGAATLWQSFLGHEVVCDSDQFDDGVATLMDFAGRLDDGVLFHYVLPVARNRALIETTVFGPRPLSAASLASHQHAAVDKFCGGVSRNIVRSEHGILPMGLTTIAPPPGENYVRAGVMNGGARPSTGYAFQRIQRWADDATTAIRSGGTASGHSGDPRFRQWMDLLFLRVVRHHPDRAADLFLSIFGMKDPTRIIRFLTDTGSLADHSAVIAALPTGQFLRELWDGLWASPGSQLELV